VRIWIALAAAAMFVLAWGEVSALEPHRETGILQINPPTPYIRYSPAHVPRGRVLVVHGLDVSKEVMQLISAALADGGFEVYAIDLPGHGDSPVPFDATIAEKAIRNVLAQVGDDSIVLGHSLGAALLLDLSDDQHFTTMVLLSPPPIPIADIRAKRTLVISGAFDVGRIREFAPLIANAGQNTEWWQLQWGGHSSSIFNPIHIRHIVDWLGGDGSNTRTLARLVWITMLFISGAVVGIGLMPGRDLKETPVSMPTALVRYVAACCVSVLILKVAVPMAWLHLFATDYLVSFLLLTGLALWVQQRNSLRLRPAAILKAAAAAAFVIVVLGLIAGSHILHITLANRRWWRLPWIALAGLPLLLFDELTIRTIYPRWKSIGVALITRALLWAFLLTGVLLLNRNDAFLVLIAHLMVLFWILLWFATGVVHRHTEDPFAAALFAALVQGWAFAAWFVTI
jgi:pimeloyl-ACP methyl ester carboxylesterase